MARVGIDRWTGAVLTGWPHCAQSLGVIVSTLVGERVYLRDFGMDGPPVQDRPETSTTIVLHFAAIANAIRKWEPGYRLRRVGVTRLGADGVAGFQLFGDFYPNGQLGDFSVVESDRNITVALGQGGVLA